MGRSYIRATLIAAIVLVQMTSYAQTSTLSADAAKTADIAKAQAEKVKADNAANSAAQNSTSSATANQDQSAKTGDSTSVSNSQAQAPSSVKNEVVVVTTAPQAIAQPTTVVTAAPLAVSKADELRKARERAEVETEQGIVEKLEKDRLESEQQRRDELLANRKKADPVVVAPVVVAPVATPAPAAAVVVTAPTADSAAKATVSATTSGANSPATATATITTAAAAQSEPVVVAPAQPAQPQKSESELRAEITQDIKADLKEVAKEEKPVSKPHISVGGVLSSMSYPDAFNTYSDFGAGVSIGWTTPNRFGVEGTFLYSQHTIDDSYSMYKKVDQQNWMVAARYNVLPSTITPVVGALMSYTRRDYTDMYDWGYGAIQGPGSTSTDSLDLGLLLGVEFAASKNIILGVDYRYMTNMTTRYSNPEAFNRSIYQSNNKDYRPLEQIDYDMVGFTLKFMF